MKTGRHTCRLLKGLNDSKHSAGNRKHFRSGLPAMVFLSACESGRQFVDCIEKRKEKKRCGSQVLQEKKILGQINPQTMIQPRIVFT